MARWPRDWPKNKDLFTRNPALQGYFSISGKQAMGTGALRLGRLYPKFEIYKFVPNVYPLNKLRVWLRDTATKEVWVPYIKRLQHVSVLGATGKGKSTKYAIPSIAYGALEDNTSYYAIDVKSPQFVRMFGKLYRKAGKHVVFFDPWSIDETLAFEPIWKASDEVKSTLSDVIATYSPEGNQGGGGGNSDYFNQLAIRMLKGLIDLAQFWPRKQCNLPCVQQLVAGGGDAIKDAFKKVHGIIPSAEEVQKAVQVLIPLDAETLRGIPRSSEVEGALAVLDRSGYPMAFLLRKMRSYHQDYAAGRMNEAEYKRVYSEFLLQVQDECENRKAAAVRLEQSQGEIFGLPPETLGCAVSTLINKMGWFRDHNVARAFSQDELDVRGLTDHPCLFLVGAPMAKLGTGSLFVASILTNLAINAVFQRGMMIEKGVKGVSKHGVFMILDEFPQLNVRKAVQAAATFRGFLSGLTFIYQDRGQIENLYGPEYKSLEANCVHKVLLQGSHEDTAEYYAKAIGEATIKKRSESQSGSQDKNVSYSIERVPRMSLNDVKNMVLNGERKEDMALSVGAETEAFPLLPIPFYEDPALRKLLGMKKTLNKSGPFWEWTERWELDLKDEKFVDRKTKKPRSFKGKDPVAERLADAFSPYLDFLLGKPTETIVRDGKEVREYVYDELEVPYIDYAAIGLPEYVSKTSAGPGGQTPRPAPGSTAGSGKAAPAGPPPQIVPIYGNDFRALVNEDFADPEPVVQLPVTGESVEDRVRGFVSFQEEDEE